jgi:glycosyltransferase involved in cell wall biosynthesis
MLAQAFIRLLEMAPTLRSRLRLVIVGEGPLRQRVVDVLRRGNARDLVWLPGARNDVQEIMRALDVFVLPSLAEGISNTILEAMSSGLPVVATRIGGNAELVDEGRSGVLVSVTDVDEMARAMLNYATSPRVAREHGMCGRARAERLFSLDAMVAKYAALYESLLRGDRRMHGRIGSSTAEASSGGC